jgi:hypothetical protein
LKGFGEIGEASLEEDARKSPSAGYLHQARALESQERRPQHDSNQNFRRPEFQQAFGRALVESVNVESNNHKSVPLRREDELEKGRNRWEARRLNPGAFGITHVHYEELKAKWAASEEAERLRVAVGGKQKVEARDRGGHSRFSGGP